MCVRWKIVCVNVGVYVCVLFSLSLYGVRHKFMVLVVVTNYHKSIWLYAEFRRKAFKLQILLVYRNGLYKYWNFNVSKNKFRLKNDTHLPKCAKWVNCITDEKRYHCNHHLNILLHGLHRIHLDKVPTLHLYQWINSLSPPLSLSL